MTQPAFGRRARRYRLASVAASLLAALLWARVAAAAPEVPVVLSLPLFDPNAGAVSLPAYRADRFELRIAARAKPADLRRASTSARFGHVALDRLLDRFGVARLEPEFPVATVPEPGSGLEDLTEFYIVYLPPGASLPEVLGAFRAEPDVMSADPIGVFELSRIPNDSLFTSQWPMDEENDHDSDFPEAWDLTTGDSTVVIAIIDSGVLWSHPDIGGPAPFTSNNNLWHNWGEIGRTPGVDDDLNGVIDDFIGWDYVTGENGMMGEDDDVADNDPSDFYGHGTMVAGFAGAIPDNVSGVAGGGWSCKIMPLRVGWADAVSGAGMVDMVYCAQAIDYATRMGASVINCSWTNGNDGGLGAAVTNAIAHGVSVVVAAGNQNTQFPQKNYLGLRGDCVDVASIDIYDRKSFFTNYGTWVDVCAGGQGVRSTSSSAYQPSYSSGDGTSFAAPHVSAAIALYQSYRKAHGLPPATPLQVLLRIRDTADDIDGVNADYLGLLGGGRLNAWRMISDPPTSYRISGVGAITTAPALVDWGGSSMATVVGTFTGLVLALDAQGAEFPGWPVSLGSAVFSNPAVWDVDFDGSPDVIVGDSDGQVHALRSDGTEAEGWPVTVGGGVWGGPALADVAGDAAYEIVFGTTGPDKLHVLDRFGEELPGWPKTMPAGFDAGPALGDLDADDKADIVIGDTDSLLHVLRGDGTYFAGWPINVGGAIYASPSLGDVDGDGYFDIAVGSTAGALHVYHADGTPVAGFPALGGGYVESAPALVNLDSDQQLEIVYGTENGAVLIRDHNGQIFGLWGRQTGGVVRGTVLVADIDDDGEVDIVAPSGDGSIYAWHLDTTPLAGFPRATGGPLLASGTIGDPDRDGRIELMLGNQNQQFWTYDFGPQSYNPASVLWPTVGHSFQREGSSLLPSIGVPNPNGPRVARLSLTPNPGRGRTVVSATFPRHPGEAVRFALYDASGRERRAQTAQLDAAGIATWPIESGGELRAGMYFVHARCGTEALTAKWVCVR